MAWIAFWVFLTLYLNCRFNKQLGGLLDAFVKRIQQGSSLEAGGLKLGPPPAIANRQVNSATSEGTAGVSLPTELSNKVRDYQQVSAKLSESTYLVHAAEIITQRSESQKGLYRVRVWLEADSEGEYNECEEVVYRLHSTFNQRIIATAAKANQFELWLNVWGEFTIIAYVKRRGQEPLWLTRYLDLPGRPPG